MAAMRQHDDTHDPEQLITVQVLILMHRPCVSVVMTTVPEQTGDLMEGVSASVSSLH